MYLVAQVLGKEIVVSDYFKWDNNVAVCFVAVSKVALTMVFHKQILLYTIVDFGKL